MIVKLNFNIIRLAVVGFIITAQVFLLPVTSRSLAQAGPEAPEASEPGIAPGWQTIRVDSQPNFSQLSQHALKLDASGYANVAFGGDHLYYARYNGSSWTQQAVDSVWGVGSGAALALDGSGKAYISYYDSANQDLKYATNKSGLWVTETVISSGNVGVYSDIALDGWGDPGIVYFNETTNSLHYINYDSLETHTWVDEQVAAVQSPGHNGWFSFALDTHVIPNQPHVSYYHYITNNEGDFKYAHYNAGGEWTSEWLETCMDPTPTNCKVGEYNAIALDPANYRPVVAYSWHDVSFANLLAYKTFDGSYWHTELVAYDTPTYLSLAFDTVGDSKKARIAWKQGGLYYTYRNAVDDWSDPESVDAGSEAGEWVSLAVTGSTPKIVHFNPSSGLLKYVNHDRNGWLAPYTLMAQGHDLGECSSLAVDKNGMLHISYLDNTNDSLHYLQAEIGEDPVIMNTIDSDGVVSCFSVVAVDSADHVVAGFIRGGNLYVSWLSGEYWLEPLLVASAVNAVEQQGFGMALGAGGYPHFAYRKGADIWYSYWTGSGWSHNLVVDELASARSVALALSPDDVPSIAYYEGSLLYHRTKNILDLWVSEQIAGSGAGVGAAIAVDSNGKVAAAYLDGIGMNLAFSSRGTVCNGPPLYTCIWNVEGVIDPQGEEYFSLAVDRSGKPQLAATVFGNPMVLHYVSRAGTTWSSRTVDANRSVGWRPSIALSTSGRPRISYHDTLNGDLLVAYQLDHVFLPLVRK